MSELVSYIHLRCITLKPSSFQVHVYSEDGALRPINAVIETPQNPKSVAVYNSVKSPFLFPPPPAPHLITRTLTLTLVAVDNSLKRLPSYNSLKRLPTSSTLTQS